MVLGVVLMVVDRRSSTTASTATGSSSIYGGVCLMLALVVSPSGTTPRAPRPGSRSARSQLQPSEFAKIGADRRARRDARDVAGRDRPAPARLALCWRALPMVLIMMQPDLGTALVFIAIIMAMLLVRPASRPRTCAILALVGVLGVFGILHSNMLQQYQKDRLTTFLDPNQDTAGVDLQPQPSRDHDRQRRSVTGEGLFQGPQTQLGYVPEQQTDFIFTVVGEELGFVGAATLLGAVRDRSSGGSGAAAQLARDQFGS